MIKDEVVSFLKETPPFTYLEDSELSNLADNIALEYFPKGKKILEQAGAPSEHLCVVKKGGVKVYVTSEDDVETVIDYRGEGEPFGLLSILSGDRSRANVVAEEDTICYQIPRENILEIIKNNPSANEYFLKSFLINFIDKSFEDTRKKYSEISCGDKLIYTTKVADVIRSTPLVASQNLSIQDAARKMVDHRVSSVVVVDENNAPVGMITDRDFREKVVASGKDVSSPINTIMSQNLVTVEASEYCFEALIRMMRHKIHHIIVMDGNVLKGMLTNHDFMVLQGSSPTVLVKEVSQIQSTKELEGTASKFHRVVSHLLRDGAKANNIAGLITELCEKVINSIADIIEKEIGPSPSPYSLFLFGDGGRRELTLDFKLQLGIITADTDASLQQELDADYIMIFASKMNQSLQKCFGDEKQYLDPQNINTFSKWKSLFQTSVSESTSGVLAKFFEMRAIRGGDAEAVYLRKTLTNIASSSEDLMELIATATVQNRPPLGFFKQFVVEKNGEHKNEVNLYEKGIMPLVNVVRIFALGKNVAGDSTSRRLQGLKVEGLDTAQDIELSLEYIRELMIHNQLQQIEEGEKPTNFVNPESLTNFEKKTLKESFQLIGTLYEVIEGQYRTERLV